MTSEMRGFRSPSPNSNPNSNPNPHPHPHPNLIGPLISRSARR